MPSASMHARNEFKLENEMTAPVVKWLAARGLRVKREFSVPWGICDLVGVKLNSNRVKIRLEHGQKCAVGSPFRLHILSILPHSESGTYITLNQLCRAFSDVMPRDFLENELTSLERMKFVRTVGTCRFQKLNGWAPLHDRIVAVELKLRRVTEAVAQASLNRVIATESYVALPFDLARRATRGPRAEQFRRAGVGLIAVSRRRCIRMIAPPNSSRDQNEILQSYCVERFWSTKDRPS
jgi:hypothetical protein